MKGGGRAASPPSCVLQMFVLCDKDALGGGGGGDVHMRSTWAVTRIRVIFSKMNSQKGMSIFTKILERPVKNSR